MSGDMFLGCLVDAGWPLERLLATVQALHLPEDLWRIHEETVMRGPLRATLVHVATTEGDAHRHLDDVRAIIQAGDLPGPVQERAVAVFTRLAEAEARVHNTTPDRIHFHEVGALDAIIDIVGVCMGLHELEIERLYASPAPLGRGWVDTMHGRIPLPAPATLELLAAVGAPTVPAPGPGELVTPTGAALLAELADFQQPAMTLDRVAYGAGQKEFAWPNVARLWIGQEAGSRQQVAGGRWQPAAGQSPNQPINQSTSQPISQSPISNHPITQSPNLLLLETNIDDMNPELYGPVREHLTAAGALDVWTTAIGMKKGRPGVLLSVLAPAEKEADLARLILQETTTLGVRVHSVRRHTAERALRTVQTVYGPVRVKLKLLDGQVHAAKPEFDDCLERAREMGVPVQIVYTAAEAAAFHGWLVGAPNTKARLVEKAAPILLRSGPTGPQVLAFRHPQAGLQLVKGTLEPGEEPFTAAVRELAEEAGVQSAEPVHLLGTLDLPEIGQRWHLVLCRTQENLPEQWTFHTQDDGGHLFAFFWYNLEGSPNEEWHPAFRKALAYIHESVQKGEPPCQAS
ncbi:MAG: nickel pincer cofactor biosynthesis protein LarC [Caldilineae bacterium]|nr:MAG: nickel pincer cofactor biosynthesis protein LarC [Caldilineae bacterium]